MQELLDQLDRLERFGQLGPDRGREMLDVGDPHEHRLRRGGNPYRVRPQRLIDAAHHDRLLGAIPAERHQLLAQMAHRRLDRRCGRSSRRAATARTRCPSRRIEQLGARRLTRCRSPRPDGRTRSGQEPKPSRSGLGKNRGGVMKLRSAPRPRRASVLIFSSSPSAISSTCARHGRLGCSGGIVRLTSGPRGAPRGAGSSSPRRGLAAGALTSRASSLSQSSSGVSSAQARAGRSVSRTEHIATGAERRARARRSRARQQRPRGP